MLSQVETVFIFAVLLPAVVTITVFVGFLICWFKCELREKLLRKCMLKKRQSSSASSSTANTIASGRIHYVKDTLDTHSAKSRHHSGGSGSMANRSGVHIDNEGRVIYGANHSNLGFELGDEGTLKNECDIDKKGVDLPGVKVKLTDLPALAVLNGQNIQTTASGIQYLPSTSVSNLSPKSDTITTATVHNISHSPQATNSQYSGLSPNHRNSHTVNISSINSHQLHYSQADIPSVHRNPKYSAKTSSQRRSELIQEFDFPHSRHHTRKLTTKPNGGLSLDNSTSSYSSSNEGDYLDKDTEYSHFIPAKLLTKNELSHKRNVHLSHGASYQPADISTTEMKNGVYYGQLNGMDKSSENSSPQAPLKILAVQLDSHNKNTSPRNDRNVIHYITNESANMVETV